MADIDDLGYKSISEMSSDEAIELLRQVRLSRRVPVKKTKTKTTTKNKAPKINIDSIDENTAAKILAILGGNK